jgi:hypothetical protein
MARWASGGWLGRLGRSRSSSGGARARGSRRWCSRQLQHVEAGAAARSACGPRSRVLAAGWNRRGASGSWAHGPRRREHGRGSKRRGARRRVAVQTRMCRQRVRGGVATRAGRPRTAGGARRNVCGSMAAHGRHRGRSCARWCAQEQAARPCMWGPSGG